MLRLRWSATRWTLPRLGTRAWWIAAVALAALAPGLLVGVPIAARAAEPAVVIPPPALDNPKAPGPTQTAVLAGGCFWGVQGVYQHVRGVQRVLSGYAGGTKATADYEAVSRGNTGHAESVEIRFDRKKISYPQLLDVFWHNVDPLTADAQFCDHGNQYRTAIFYHDEEQRQLALASMRELQKRFKEPIVTQIVPASEFWPAEAYHQDYYKKNPIRYRFYRFNCGRDARLEQVWGKAPEH